MLQVIVEHYKDETVSVKKICDDSTVLSVMKNTGVIDLDVCVPYINKQIEVHHNYIDSNENNYVLKAKLEAVEIDPMTQVKCIKYTPIN